MPSKKTILFLCVFAIGAVIIFITWKVFYRQNENNQSNPVEPSVSVTPLSPSAIQEPQIILQDLLVPWDIAFLPSGEMIVTERQGKLIVLGKEKKVIDVPDVYELGEGGLLGIAVHPKFSENNLIYLYFTIRTGSRYSNNVVRYVLKDFAVTDKKVILENIPAGMNHNGGRIRFGPDGFLYIATGDAGNSSNARNVNSLGGKILRLTDNGDIPADNPFPGKAIYSLGHRNVQGLAWDNDGNLWATEHGRSGAASGYDEINKIQAGKDYGWPIIQGDQSRDGMETPFIHSGASTTWAPSGLAFYNGNLYFAGLKGEALYELNIATKKLTRHLYQTYGRLRAVTIGADDFIYLTTSNRDGRGSASKGDDLVVKVDGRRFKTE